MSSPKTGAGKRVPSLPARATRIRLLLMDVDGVLTDGRVYLQSGAGETAVEIKGFSVLDGVGLKMARTMGLRTGVITGRSSAATAHRARELGMEFVYQGHARKLLAYEAILARAGVTDEEVCYIGDDLPDIPVMKRVGLAVAVSNAAAEAAKAAHYVTQRAGGNGAAREVIEVILKAQGKWVEAVRRRCA